MTVLVDSNVPMYLVGADHPNKERAQQRLEELITSDERIVTDVEVLQEILHRYTAIDRSDAIQPAFSAILDVADEVLPVTLREAEEAKEIVLGRHGLLARDALHLAVMRSYGIDRIVSFDTAFDEVPGVERIG